MSDKNKKIEKGLLNLNLDTEIKTYELKDFGLGKVNVNIVEHNSEYFEKFNVERNNYVYTYMKKDEDDTFLLVDKQYKTSENIYDLYFQKASERALKLKSGKKRVQTGVYFEKSVNAMSQNLIKQLNFYNEKNNRFKKTRVAFTNLVMTKFLVENNLYKQEVSSMQMRDILDNKFYKLHTFAYNVYNVSDRSKQGAYLNLDLYEELNRLSKKLNARKYNANSVLLNNIFRDYFINTLKIDVDMFDFYTVDENYTFSELQLQKVASDFVDYLDYNIT